MPRQTPKTNSRTHRLGGFSTVEMMIMMVVIAIVTSLGLIGITNARAAVRLSGSARQYASYIEKARIFSIRRHADDAAERASVAINENRTSYDVTMDLDGDGGMDTRTIALPSGITFETVETIAFDWRGRTWNTANGVTSSNAQVSIRLLSSDDSISVDVTGSGDVTIDSRVFDDAVPNVNLHVADLSGGATPTPTPNVSATPDTSASPSPLSSPLPEIIPIPTPDLGGLLPSPRATPTPTPSPTPAASPAATPRANPTPTPMPAVCTINADKAAVLMGTESTATIKVSHDANVTLSIDGTSSRPSDLQVTPGGPQDVGTGGQTSFTIKSKKTIGAYTVTFSSGCGSKVVPVVVAL